ncbi:hypothetical protein ASD16_19440 [Cellulomonas sp. Root485]|nr:hypothetical protein ASD16_19440 [Cellulomonas sp. Root485]
MGGKLVAHYVGADGRAIIIQIGRWVYPIDGKTTARARVHLGGLYSTLVLARPNMPTLRLVLPTPLRHLSLDSDYTDGAESLASHVGNPVAQRYFRELNDYTAGPWHLLKER